MEDYYPRTLLLVAPTASPSPTPAAPGIPDARMATPRDAETGSTFTLLNANAVIVLALLICALMAAIALHVVLQCALRVTRAACYADGAAAGAVPELTPSRRAVQARRGGRKLRWALPCLAYSEGLELAGSSRSECAICLAEFARGEQVRVLPRCRHGFHARCIDRWLAARSTCPTCRQPPFAEPDRAPAAADHRAGVAVVPVVVRVMVDNGVSLRVEL